MGSMTQSSERISSTFGIQVVSGRDGVFSGIGWGTVAFGQRIFFEIVVTHQFGHTFHIFDSFVVSKIKKKIKIKIHILKEIDNLF